MSERRALLIGYGNPAHGDDGLGQAFAEGIAECQLEGLTIQTDFQLSADHAYDMAQHDLVIFADALISGDEPFRFEEILDPKPEVLGSHTVSPVAALALCTLLFQASPRTFMLGIRGHAFGDIEEGLSDAARANLQIAQAFFERWYVSDLTEEMPTARHAGG